MGPDSAASAPTPAGDAEAAGWGRQDPAGLTDTSRGAKPGASCSAHTCNIHRGKSPPSYHWLSVLLRASAAARSTEPDPGTSLTSGMCLLVPGEGRKAVGRHRRG